jgi:3-phosphoglycerate kinase
MKKYDTLFTIMQQTVIPLLESIPKAYLKNKTALVRVDYNVPIQDGLVSDDARIKASLDTIYFLLKNEANIVLLSHLGRPKGKPVKKYTLHPIANYLSELLNQTVHFSTLEQLESPKVANSKIDTKNQITLLENVRYFEGEEKNNARFAERLSAIADIYVNDAFSTSHRDHASITGIPNYLPSYAGISFAKEVLMLGKVMHEPQRPFIMVIGGAKISDKVEAVQNLAQIADAVLIGGGTANNFLKAEGIDICKSLVEEPKELLQNKEQRSVNYVEVAQDMIEKTRTTKILLDGYIPIPKIILPIDVIAAKGIDETDTEVVELLNCKTHEPDMQNLMYLDIGPKTIKLFKEILLQAGTIFWNGPMGVFEKEQFSTGTKEIARTIAKAGATTILGGGDTIASIRTFSEENRYDYVSAAGGAALAFLAGKKLPGIQALKNSNRVKIAKNT